MWKPANVVPEHKKRARVVWGILLLAIVGYTAWQIATLVRKFDNPSTEFSMSDVVFEFPTLEVCVWGGYGCDESLGENVCIGSAVFTVYDPCFRESLGANTTSEWEGCLALDLSTVDMQGFAGGCGVGQKPSISVTVAWITSVAPEEEEDFRESVGVALGDESTPDYVTVPYTRVVKSAGDFPSDTTYAEAELVIGKNNRISIGGGSTASYPVLSILTSSYVDQNATLPDGTTSSYDSYSIGYLHLTVTQGRFSVTEVTEINPLDIGALLGNIGGFWELLLVAWGLFFIATRSQSSTQKGRDFTKSIQKGKNIVSRKRLNSSTRMATPESKRAAAERPYWNNAGRDAQEANESSFRVVPPVGARPPVGVAVSSFRRPVQQDYPTRTVSISTRSLVTGESFMATGGGGSAIPQDQPPAYSDCA